MIAHRCLRSMAYSWMLNKHKEIALTASGAGIAPCSSLPKAS
jgi:hypothetical protein